MPDPPVLDGQDGGDGGQREGVRGAVPGLAVGAARAGRGSGQRHPGDQLAVLDDGVPVRAVAGQPVELRDRHRPLAGRPAQPDLRVQGGEGDRHVRRVGGDAVGGVAEHREVAVDALPGGAARAGRALVARLRRVLEVRAAGALEQVAPGGGRVPQLRGGTGQEGLREGGVADAHERVGGHVAVARGRADVQAARGGLLDGVERQPVDVDEQRGPRDPQLHQVHEIGPAREEPGAGLGGEPVDRLLGALRPDIGEGLHRAASSIASTMFG